MSMKNIKIDDEVYSYLQQKAIAFEETFAHQDALDEGRFGRKAAHMGLTEDVRIIVIGQIKTVEAVIPEIVQGQLLGPATGPR